MTAEEPTGGRRAVPFSSLDPVARKEVKLAAARGELHPDPIVAASSIEWARSRLTKKATLRAVAVLAVGSTINAVAFHDAPDGAGLVELWRSRRLGRRIVRAAERAGVELPAWAFISSARGAKIPVSELVTRAGFGIELQEGRRPRRHGRALLRRRQSQFRQSSPDS